MSEKGKLKLLKTMLSEWKWLFGYIKRYKFSITVYIFFGAVASVTAIGVSLASKYLIDAVISKDGTLTAKAAVATVALLVFQVVFQTVASRITAIISTRVNNELRNEIFSSVIKADWLKISSFRSGELMNRIEGDVSGVTAGVVNFIPNAFTKLVTFIGSFCVVLYYDKIMALLALMSAPFFVVSSRFLIRTLRKYNVKSREMNGEVLSFSEEALRNIQVIKAFDLTKQYIENFRTVTDRYRQVKLEYEKFNVLLTMVLSLLGIVVSYSCYGWGVYRLWQGAITVGTMTLFLQISSSLTSSFSGIASLAPSAVSIATAAGRIMEISAYEAESDADSELSVNMLENSEGKIKLTAENLSFEYEKGSDRVLSDISFEFTPGDTIGIVGRSGEGKTTLLRVLLGLVKPLDGKIYIEDKNGTKINISDSTRRFFSYVPQESCMFSGTIEENLRLVKPNATDEEIMQVLKIACFDEFINEQSEGLSYTIEENGSNLSRGQLQRISIARALLRDAPIVLLDEATSGLDSETEKELLENISNNIKDKIILLTTHRESLLNYCTDVYKITRSGNMVPFGRE